MLHQKAQHNDTGCASASYKEEPFMPHLLCWRSRCSGVSVCLPSGALQLSCTTCTSRDCKSGCVRSRLPAKASFTSLYVKCQDQPCRVLR